MSQPPQGDAPQPPDDDFAQMLQSVRAASGAPPQAPPRPRPRKTTNVATEAAWVSFLGLAVIGAVVLAGLIGLAYVSVWSTARVVAQGAGANNASQRVTMLRQRRLERYRVAVDTSITPLEAGRLLHAISNAGAVTAPRPWETTAEPQLPAVPCCAQYSKSTSRLFDDRASWTVAAFRIARRGFTAEQRKILRDAAQGPVTQFRRVAHAQSADISGSLWAVPADTTISWTDLPSLPAGELRSVAVANVAAAALDLEAGRPAVAEQRLREIVSVGFLLRRGARSAIEDMAAGMLVSLGRSALEAFFRAVGRGDDATFVSSESDPVTARPSANSRIRSGDLRETLRRRILDTNELSGIRWQLMLGPFAYLPCASIRQAIFGPGARHRADLKEFHDALVVFPSDERRFTMITRNIAQMIDPGTSFRTSPTRPAWAPLVAALTRSRQLEQCASVFRR